MGISLLVAALVSSTAHTLQQGDKIIRRGGIVDDACTQSKPAVQLGTSEKGFSAWLKLWHQRAIDPLDTGVVSCDGWWDVAKTDDAERYWRQALEIGRRIDERGQLMRQGTVVLDTPHQSPPPSGSSGAVPASRSAMLSSPSHSSGVIGR